MLGGHRGGISNQPPGFEATGKGLVRFYDIVLGARLMTDKKK